MATQTGIIQIQGTVGNVVFRRDGSVSTKPAARKITARRTLENNDEFGRAGSYGKYVREALRSVMAGMTERGMTGRLSCIFSSIIKADTVGARGKRVFDSTNSAPLLGFNFGKQSLGGSFHAPHTADINGQSVEVTIPVLDPRTDVSAPAGATHCELIACGASIDMETGKADVASGMTGPIALTAAAAPVSINAKLTAVPAAANLDVVAVGIRFYQEVNGQFYPLQDTSANALTIEYVN